MKARIYAILLITAFFAGAIGVFFAASSSLEYTIKAVAGFVASLFIVPAVHEFGHASFACANQCKVFYCKFFCFKFYRKDKKMRFSLASPFGGDETRFLPKSGENVQKRVLPVIGGGLLYSGVLTAVIATSAVLLLCFNIPQFTLWGMLPYATYLFLLNVIPVEYASGKTDALIYREVKKQTVEGKAFVSVLTIQGRLYAGESYGEIPLEFYDTYALREDEPLYALLWDFKYHYYLEQNDLESAADALNRLIVSQEYLTEEGAMNVRVESAYMFLLQRDASALKALQESEEDFLRGEDYRAKRLLATYAYACGEKERTTALITQAEKSLEKEEIQGIVKHEKCLLARLDV